jgi:hypothetical protein
MAITGGIDSFDREPAGKHEFTVADVGNGFRRLRGGAKDQRARFADCER